MALNSRYKVKSRLAALILCLALQLTACAKPATWQEQYDLGLRYLSEGSYEEAILAFTAAIEIDPKQTEAYIGRGDAYVLSSETEENLAAALADYEEAIALNETAVAAYLGLADVYIRQGDIEKALTILQMGYEYTQDEVLQLKIDDIQTEEPLENIGIIKEKLKEIVKKIDIPFIVDSVELGITPMEVVIDTYRDYPGANRDKREGRGICATYGNNAREDYPMREGYKERDVAFLFGSGRNKITSSIRIGTPEFLCFDSLRIGDDGDAVLNKFGIKDIVIELLENTKNTSLECSVDGERALVIWLESWRDDGFHYSYIENHSFILTYYENEMMVELEVIEDKLHSVYMFMDSINLYEIGTIE